MRRNRLGSAISACAVVVAVFGLTSCGHRQPADVSSTTTDPALQTGANGTASSGTETSGESSGRPANPFTEGASGTSAGFKASSSGNSVSDMKKVPEKDRKLSKAEITDKDALVSKVLDPQRFRTKRFEDKPQVPAAYDIAKKHPDVLKRLFCYCGCDRTEQHVTLLDCFTDPDEHGSTCSECIDEAFLADRLLRDGATMARIQEMVDEQFCTKYPFSPAERTKTYKNYLAQRLYTDSKDPICGDNYSKE